MYEIKENKKVFTWKSKVQRNGKDKSREKGVSLCMYVCKSRILSDLLAAYEISTQGISTYIITLWFMCISRFLDYGIDK